MIIGEAVKIATIEVKSECGFNGNAGYSERLADVKYNADAKVSFITLHPNPLKIKTLNVGGMDRDIIRAVQSDYIPNMWNFFINF